MKTARLVLLAFLIASVTPKILTATTPELTPELAKKVIEGAMASDRIPFLSLTGEEIAHGTRAGYWVAGKDKPDSPEGLQLTEAGKKLFTYLALQSGRTLVSAKQPFSTFVVKIDKIGDGPESGRKTVEFTWNYKLENQPKELQELFRSHPDESL